MPARFRSTKRAGKVDSSIVWQKASRPIGKQLGKLLRLPFPSAADAGGMKNGLDQVTI
jgi:hypothetical protein